MTWFLGKTILLLFSSGILAITQNTFSLKCKHLAIEIKGKIEYIYKIYFKNDAK